MSGQKKTRKVLYKHGPFSSKRDVFGCLHTIRVVLEKSLVSFQYVLQKIATHCQSTNSLKNKLLLQNLAQYHIKCGTISDRDPRSANCIFGSSQWNYCYAKYKQNDPRAMFMTQQHWDSTICFMFYHHSSMIYWDN